MSQKNSRPKLILFINTSDPKKNQIALRFGGAVIKKAYKTKYNQTESLLSKIDQLFIKAKKTPQDLSGIAIVTGMGHFTALRVGITVANTLSVALDIPITGLRGSDFSSFDEFVQISEQKLLKQKSRKLLVPFYGREPNITLAKRSFIP